MRDRISSFLDNFKKVGTQLAGCGIRKQRGAKPLAVFTAIFTLPFGGVNFSRDIVHNRELGFQEDNAYEVPQESTVQLAKISVGPETVVVRWTC